MTQMRRPTSRLPHRRVSEAAVGGRSRSARLALVLDVEDGRERLAFGPDAEEWMTAEERDPSAGPAFDPRPHPTGRRVAYIADGALHAIDLDSGLDHRLAHIASPIDPTVPSGPVRHPHAGIAGPALAGVRGA